MSDLTIDEKLNAAQRRAREHTLEKHYFDAAQPFFPRGFTVYRRNSGHWDVSARQCPGRIRAWLEANPGSSTSETEGEARERAFRIRGEPGAVVVFDERWNPHRPHPREPLRFRSVAAAMLWISEEMMQDPPNV
ncbi:hypothetical protein [Chenggangzhangella methanolivorans]|uniref:Uncharacterized protein n=1 Tax=Chenggangzhangella methanolivorans TaxID=1437009 RepID=A0A9E6RAE9_9HYPH|nr:hypothetical protein [Chenggangzhangella methanolivorans]QZN99753.1 hypothetical protein K6K41_24315 [Chenggangzhangella methanolivorans]